MQIYLINKIVILLKNLHKNSKLIFNNILFLCQLNIKSLFFPLFIFT